MSRTISKVVLAGASGNLGPAILNALVEAGFEVTILSRKADTKAPQGVKVAAVDYTSLESLKSALAGQDAVVSTLGAPALAGQQLLIDAAVAAGVKHFVPSEFGSDTTDPHTATLPVFGYKVATRKHLEQVAANSSMTYSGLITGAFFDWCLEMGVLFIRKDRTATIIDGGDVPLAMTTLKDIGHGVVSMLRHPEKFVNRSVFINSVVTSQNKIIAAAEKAGLTGWKTNTQTAASLEKEGADKFKSDPAKPEAWALPMILGDIFGHAGQYFDHMGADNEVVGVRFLTEAEIEEVVKAALS